MRSLAAQLADLPEKFAAWGMRDLRRYQRITYEVKANWKLIILNYNECLHCPLLHSALNRFAAGSGSTFSICVTSLSE
jgi:Rieske 2Fe-2S family protein